jgi:hypothetical protein
MILSQARTARDGHRDFNREKPADSSDGWHDSVPVPQHFLVRVAVPTRGHEFVLHRDFGCDSIAVFFARRPRCDVARRGAREFMARDSRVECFFHCDAGAGERAVL